MVALGRLSLAIFPQVGKSEQLCAAVTTDTLPRFPSQGTAALAGVRLTATEIGELSGL